VTYQPHETRQAASLARHMSTKFGVGVVIRLANRTLLVTDNAECVEAGERIVAMFRDGEPVEVQEVAL